MISPSRDTARLWAQTVGLLPDNSHPMPETKYMRKKLDSIHKLVLLAFSEGIAVEKRFSKKKGGFSSRTFGPLPETHQRNSEIGFTGGY